MHPKTKRNVVIGAVAAGLVLAGLLMLNTRTTPPVNRTIVEGSESGQTIAAKGTSSTLPPTTLPDSATNSTSGPVENGESSGKTTETVVASEVSTTASELTEAEEAEMKARERYELAQQNAYQFRKTDPSKVVPTPLTPALAESAKKYNIPQDLLTALMLVESGGSHRDGDHSMEGGFGVMNLKENNLVDTLAEAASLVGATEEEVLYNQKLNIEAAAALLSRYYEDALANGLEGGDAWYMAVSQYSGRPNPALAAALADEVAGMLMRGMQTSLSDGGGEVKLEPNPNPIFFPKNWQLAGVTPPPSAQNQVGGAGAPELPEGGDDQESLGTVELNSQSAPSQGASGSDGIE